MRWRIFLSPISQKIDQFFASRAVRSDQVALGLKNVYIFLSRQGYLFGLLLLVTFVTGVNYGNNLVLGLFFYLFAIWLVSVFYTFVQVSSLQFKLLEVSLAQAQSVAWVTLEITTTSRQPNRQIVLYFDDVQQNLVDNKKVIASLNKSTVVRLPVYAKRRGRVHLPRLNVHSTYPLGIMKAWAYVYFQSELFVYPKPIAFDWQQVSHSHAEQTEVFSPFMVAGQEDFDRLDMYQQGESLARVSWTHLARGAGMLTKHFANSAGYQWRLEYAKMPSSNHEQKLGELVYAIYQLKEQQVPFMLILSSTQGQLGSGDAFIWQSLKQIAIEP